MIEILHGAGNGSFSPFSTVGSGAQPNDLATADFNGDGNVDLIAEASNVSDPAVSQLNVFLGAGNGNFDLLNSYNIDNSSSAVSLGDVDGDGKVDVISRSTDPATGKTRATI